MAIPRSGHLPAAASLHERQVLPVLAAPSVARGRRNLWTRAS